MLLFIRLRLLPPLFIFLVFAADLFPASPLEGTRPVPRGHPRLLGSAEYLRELAEKRPDDFYRVTQVALEREGGYHEQMISMALVYAVRGDRYYGETAVKSAMRYIEGPIRTGHQTFGADLARCALVYDLCHDCWTLEQKASFIDYFNRTVDANVRSETSVFHNGWYSYKSWGIGLAAYATYYENPRAPEILAALKKEYTERVIPGFELAGAGGGWAEGYYVNYWTYKWLFFCEAAMRCEGADFFSAGGHFLPERAVASMLEHYPGIGERGSRRPVPMGDGGGRVFTGERDENLCVRRMLVSRFRDDPDHRVVHAFNLATPRVGASVYAYKDFLWRNDDIEPGSLEGFRLSHISTGPGYVSARSSWEQDATYFFFKCGDRFTAHQHLDNGHFLIYKHEELAGDGGQFYAFDTDHEVNYQLRSIAHSTILVHDPSETWPHIRAFGGEMVNDGGQHHDWPHHNGATFDAAKWRAGRELYDIADITAFEDRGDYLYVSGDCTRSYSPDKLELFTRRIVYLRPGTFVIFDRVRSTDASFRKSWLLQAMNTPRKLPDSTLEISSGAGRLFVRTLLPVEHEVALHDGEDLYSYGGRHYPPLHEVGRAPRCRVEVSPATASREDYFLHVLVAADTTVSRMAPARMRESDDEVVVETAGKLISFSKHNAGGWIETAAEGRREFASTVVQPR